MNGVAVGAVVLRLVRTRVLQRIPPAPGLGALTGLERRNSALWRGSLREVPGTERRILVSRSGLGWWKLAGGLVGGFHTAWRDTSGVRREPGRCGPWDVLVAVDQDQRMRDVPDCNRSGAVFTVGGL